MLEVLTALPLDALPLAHQTDFPHEESSSGGGVNAFLIAAGALVTLLAVGALLWLKGRMRELDREHADGAGPPPSGAERGD